MDLNGGFLPEADAWDQEHAGMTLSQCEALIAATSQPDYPAAAPQLLWNAGGNMACKYILFSFNPGMWRNVVEGADADVTGCWMP